jgi:hypothetical protein
LASSGAATQAALQFDHLHLADGLDYYEGLFDPAVTQRTTIAGFTALRSDAMLLLFGRPPGSVSVTEGPSAIWHFGWGDVTLGETYLRHAAREVTWEPPLPARKLHVHLQSRLPGAAAAWYRDVLGAQIEMTPDATRSRRAATRPELRPAEAVVRFGAFALAIHRADERLVTTRGQRVDHLALACASLAETLAGMQRHAVPTLQPIAAFGEGRHALIEGPDRIVIELVESRALALPGSP